MNHAVLIAGATIGGLVGLAALVGYLLGRHSERASIAEWLWDQNEPGWRLSASVDLGEHRRPDRDGA